MTDQTEHQFEVRITGTMLRQSVPGSREGVGVVEEQGAGGMMLYRLLLAVHEEHGATQIVPVTIEGELRAIINRSELAVGARMTLNGHLARMRIRDTRFVSKEHPNGYTYDAPSLVIRTASRASADDPDETYVRLRGTITDLPRFVRHNRDRDLEVASTQIKLELSQRDRHGRASYVTGRIPLLVPVLLPQVESALRAGNEVDIIGWLDMGSRDVPRGNPAVASALATHDQYAEQDVQHIRTTDRAGNTLPAYLMDRRRDRVEVNMQRSRTELLQLRTIRVLAGAVQLVKGTPLSIDAARAEDQARLEQKAAEAKPGTTTSRRPRRRSIPVAASDNGVSKAADPASDPVGTPQPSEDEDTESHIELAPLMLDTTMV